MPTGIILSSGSKDSTKEQVEEVLERHGLEVDRPAVEPAAEPQRDSFETEEEFEAAHVAWQETQPKPKVEKEEDDKDAAAQSTTRTQRKIQRRIDAATKDLKEENRKLAERLAALEGKAPEEPAKEENPRPKRADFKNDEEYEDALLSWGTAKALSEKSMRDAHDAEQQRLQENYDNYRAQVEEFKDEHDDWDDVVNQDIPMHTGVQLAVMEQENGAEVIYYLGKHPEYAMRLAEMQPLSAVMEVGRLSERLKAGAPGTGEANGGQNGKPKPKVPAPFRPVNTAATSSTLTSRDAAQKRDFKAFKAAQRAGR